MENLKNQLMKIVMEQDEELERFREQDYWYKEYQQLTNEKALLQDKISKLLEEMGILKEEKQSLIGEAERDEIA